MDEVSRQARLLHRYEADLRPLAGADLDPALTLFQPFGPLIGRSTVPAAVLGLINRFADTQIRPDRSSEFLVPPEVARTTVAGAPSLLDFLHAQIKGFVLASERCAPAKVRIETIWVVSQYAGTPSPMHFHSSDVSGVMYLKAAAAPDPAELQRTYLSGRHAGYINFLSGGKQSFSKSIVSFPPSVGTAYVFPGWLLHGAEPFRGPGERRSLAFNAAVTFAEADTD